MKRKISKLPNTRLVRGEYFIPEIILTLSDESRAAAEKSGLPSVVGIMPAYATFDDMVKEYGYDVPFYHVTQLRKKSIISRYEPDKDKKESNT